MGATAEDREANRHVCTCAHHEDDHGRVGYRGRQPYLIDHGCRYCDCAAFEPIEAAPREWQTIETAPENVEVMTKIDDARGCRNEQGLIRKGRLWFLPDGSMYVYYAPTHWMPK